MFSARAALADLCFVIAVLIPLNSLANPPSGVAFKNTVILPDPANNIPQLIYGDAFGGDIAALGDLDGDGNDDLAVVESAGGNGQVTIVFLNGDGSAKSAVEHALGVNGLPPPSTYGAWGESIEALGDLDGDGVVDIAVGDPTDGEWPLRYGSVWILFLNADGSIKSHTKISHGVGGFVGPLFDLSYFGSSLAFLGDIDGDGVRELAVGSTEYTDDPGSLYILDIDSTGPVTSEVHITSGIGGFPATLANGDRFGSAAVLIDDMDGNSITDVAVGASAHDDGSGGTGAVWVLFMNSACTVDSVQRIGPNSGGLVQAPNVSDWFGSGLAWLPDAGCGRRALAVGAKYHDGPISSNTGAVWFLMLNADGTVADEYVLTEGDPSLRAYSLFTYNGFVGDGLASLGDWDGDGITDVAIGGPQTLGRGRVGLVTLETCRVEPRDIDMGSILVDSFADTIVTITNNGCTNRSGPVSLTGSNYVLVGPNSVDLDPGEHADITIRFSPVDVENPTAMLSTPWGDVELTGIGYFPACFDRWNIGTFRAANLDTTAGNHALWCGVPGGTPGFNFAPGYGNGWWETIHWSAPAQYSNVPTEVRLSFVYNSDFLFEGDYLRIQIYRLGSLIDFAEIYGSTLDSTGVFVEPGVFDTTWTVNPVDYIDLGGGQNGIALRLEVLTNHIYSDQDFFDTDGAIQIDNVVVRFDGTIVSSADFEPGGSDGGWCSGQSYPDPTPQDFWSSMFGAPPGGQGLNSEGFDLLLYDGKLAVGGRFTQAGSIAANRVAAWDGSQWSTFGSGIGEGTVWALAEYNGELIVTGDFDTTGAGDPAVNIARWDGTSWQGMSPPGGSNTIWAAYADNNYFYASTYTSSPFQGYLAWWDGTSWSSHNLPSSHLILDFAPYQGKLYLCGSGGSGGFLLHWDGSSIQGPGGVFNNDAYAIREHDDGLLYVGGSWNIPGPPGTQHGVAAWDGTSWVPLGADYPLSTNTIHSLNGRLIIGGDYGLRSYEGDTYVPMAANGLYTTRDLETYQGDLYVTGAFTDVGGMESYYIAAWTDPVVGIEDVSPPVSPRLQVTNYPNPFNPTTTIRVDVPERHHVTIGIYDVKGRLVRALENGVRDAGPLYLKWDGTNNAGVSVGSGVYFTRARAGSDTVTRKIVFLK